MEALWRVVSSMKAAAARAGVTLVTGDTKVVDKGHGDGVYVNTSGVGLIERNLNIVPRHVAPGDAVLLSGDIGRHGMAIMAAREGLAFEDTLKSDTAPLWSAVCALIDAGIDIHCLRDLTRGGLAAAVVEIAQTAGRGLTLDEGAIPVSEEVRGACDILGLDPLYVANEGRFVAFVPPGAAERALAIMRAHALGLPAVRIGTVRDASTGDVIIRTALGTERVLDLLSGEQLPRIC